MADIREKILNAIAEDDILYINLLKKTDINFIYFDETALIGAVSSENEQTLEYLLSIGANVNLTAGNMTALGHAAQTGLPRICTALLHKGASLKLGHTHPVFLLLKNYENLDSKKAIDTLAVLLKNTDKDIYEELISEIFFHDFIDIFKYIFMTSFIPLEQTVSLSKKLLNTHNGAPLIRDFFKTRDFFDKLDKQLVDKKEKLNIIKI